MLTSNYKNTHFLVLHVRPRHKNRYLGNREWYHRSTDVKTTTQILNIKKMDFCVISLTHYPIIAPLHGSHDLRARKAG